MFCERCTRFCSIEKVERADRALMLRTFSVVAGAPPSLIVLIDYWSCSVTVVLFRTPPVD